VVCVKARLWPAVTTAGLYPRTKHLEARPLLATEAGFAAANAREEAAGSWKARRLAVADSRAGTDMAAAIERKARLRKVRLVKVRLSHNMRRGQL